MIISIMIAFLLAKYNKYSIKYIFKSIWLLPFLMVELTHMVFQITALNGIFIFIPYAAVIKKAYLYALLLPVIQYKLYKPSLIGACFIMLGTAMNHLVIAVNNGKMPVYATLSKLTGYYDSSIMGSLDTLHCVGDSTTKLKLFTDYIDIGFGILSLGDLLVHSFTIIIVYYTIQALNNN